MDKNLEEQLSKKMSFVLRHKPEKFGLKLTKDGYCTLQELSKAINETVENIQYIVENCSKQRYSIVNNRVKANYGHSFKIERESSMPPDILYHGTNTKVVDSILEEGIKSIGRDVHMSESTEFATLAGQRRGKLVILKVDSKLAYEEGVKFYYAGNEVWLSGFIPPKYLKKEGN